MKKKYKAGQLFTINGILYRITKVVGKQPCRVCQADGCIYCSASVETRIPSNCCFIIVKK